ncbi:fungal-specific transcription factor domain-containing protein [Hypoxylon crocopeplum]|nr:fungal-specific transcription factor domain-containing protein [Hypoxylon crocopeplum]
MAESTSQNRRRDKPVLSCTFCRGRKLRCDRQYPCSACVRRGRAAECAYSSSEQERKDAIDYRPHTRRQQARQRVARLENLIIEMRDKEQSSRQPSGEVSARSTAPSNGEPPLATLGSHVIDDMGNLNLTDNHAVYTGSSHWVTILEDIRGLRDELGEDYSNSAASPEPAPLDAGLMCGSQPTGISLLNSAPCLAREQILSMMPPRKVVDRHVSQFFNTFDMGPFILHRSKFLAEYANFWENPWATPIMWVGLLFSVMAVSAFLQLQDPGAVGLSTAESQKMLTTYRASTIYCLVAGDYLRPSRYTVETLTLHFTVDQNVNLDTSIGNWILVGVVVRIALRCGLHRDPSHWPEIRPLQAELRRRLWITLYQMDFFTSVQVGLPRIIKDSQCDTHPPAHLFDHDIGFENDEIPPERPMMDPTPLLYVIQRNTIIKVAAEIYDTTEAEPPSPDTIASLGLKLERATNAIPSWLKYRSLEKSITDDPIRILHQIVLDTLIHKSVYLLHRRSFLKGSVGEESKKSNEICIKAALAVLEHQRQTSEETQPGGLMFGIRWKVATSLNHEFLQATMLLCFALSTFKEGHVDAIDSATLHRRDDILEALAISKDLWEKNADRSLEARRAAKAITTVLRENSGKPDALSWAASDGLFEQRPDAAAQFNFGSFAYEDIALDPSLLGADGDMAEVEGVLDDFVVDQSYA